MNNNNRRNGKENRNTFLKIFENIVADSIFCNDEYVKGDEVEATIAQCFLEELYSIEYDNDNCDGWKDILTTVMQDVGGYASDVIDDVIMEIVNKGGAEFVKYMKEEDTFI